MEKDLELYVSLFNENRSVMLLIDSETGSIINCNKAACTFYGWNHQQLCTKTLATLSNTPISDIKNSLVRAVTSSETFIQTKHTLASGATRDVELWFTPVSSVTSNRLFVTIQDITNRQHNDDILKMLTVTIDAAADAAYWLNKDGRIVYVNRSGCAMLGYTKEELLQKYIFDINPKVTPQTWSDLWETMRSQERFTAESTHQRKDGTLFPVELASTYFKSGENEYINGFARNISERKRVEEEMRKTQKFESLGILAGGIAHDFNNILGAIVGYADMSLDDVPEGSDLRHNLNQILKSSDRAKDLVRQILAFSRQQPDELGPVNVYPILKEVLQLLRSTLPSTIEIKNRVYKDAQPLQGNSNRIHEVIMNLCVNAAQAMQERGTLEINHEEVMITSDFSGVTGTSKAGMYSIIEIKDSGCGIAADVLPHIFEPYFTTKAVGEGTGLGLAVVLGTIQSHKGNITVESEPGKGTSFKIFLPKSDVKPAREVIENHVYQRGTERILFIDDECILCEVANHILGTLGYTVVSYSNSLKALEDFTRDPRAYDLIITDQTMPAITGIELAKEFLRIRKDIPIILCTGYSRTVDEEVCRDAGIRLLCTKPINKSDIAEKIRLVLDTSRREAPHG